MTLSSDDIKVLIAEFQASDWEEMSLTVGDMSLVISRSSSAQLAPASTPPAATSPSAAPVPVAAAPAAPVEPAHPLPVAPTSDAARRHTVASPTIGLFWRSPQPGAPPYVEVGEHIDAGDVVCIIEVMKLMHHVQADVAGTVVSVGPENGAMVEHGTVLLEIVTDA